MRDQGEIRAEWQKEPEVVVSEAVSTAMEKTDPSESINALLSYIGQSMSADRAYVFEFATEDILYNSYEWCAPGVTSQIGNLDHTSLDIYKPVWLPRFLKHEPVVITDIDEYAKEDRTVADILRPQNIRSLIAIPLFMEGSFQGFIGIDNPAQGVVDGMAAFLQTLASFTSALLRHRNNVQRLYDLSSHDKVSGAFNTLYLLDKVEQARAAGSAESVEGIDLSDIGDLGRISVVYCNIVQFKEYNGAFGIDEGNRCLADIAVALRKAFATKCVSRYSADHFIVFYGGDDVWERVDRAHELVLGVRDSFKLWLEAGVCTPDPSEKLSVAVDLAKVACDQIPKDGQSYKCLYTGKIEEELERRKYLQDHVDQAIDEGWLRVYYQPVIRTLTGRLAGVEALSRWQDPQYGAVSPGVFVPALEEKHLSWKLLEFVIDRVCHDLSDRLHANRPVVPVSVNVSRTDFESCEPFDVIQGALDRYGIPSGLICVEITESVAMGDPKGVEAVVEQFSEAGYEVWMDDFGSAYSSLNTLKNFSFGKLKLDMLFMRDFNERSKIIISSIISMAKRLGVHTLAEGVETREQVEFLLDAGCEEIQGFYFSKPLPLEELSEFVKTTPEESYDQHEVCNELGLVKVNPRDDVAFVAYRDGRAHVLYATAPMRDRLAANGLHAANQADALINDYQGRFGQTFMALVERVCESGQTEVLPFSFRTKRFQLAAQVAVRGGDGVVLLMRLRDVSAPTMTADHETAQEAGREGAASWSLLLMDEDGRDVGEESGSKDEASQDGPDLLGMEIGVRAADELRRGFSIPSKGVASSSMDIRHSKADSLETFSALSSIFVTLVNIDFTTWKAQPIKIARVTRDYLSGSDLDYREAAEKFIQRGVAPSYQDVVRRFIDPSVIVDRVSKYGTVTVDYMGAKLGWCRLFLIPISMADDGRVTKALLAARDINAEKAEEERMDYDVTHDPLTKALNRNGLRQAVHLIRGYQGAVAYAILDVDDFKSFNDSFGHEKGDELLMTVARILIDSFDATDYVARIGGDEFVVLFTHYVSDQTGDAIIKRLDDIGRQLARESALITEGEDAHGPHEVSMSSGVVVSLDGYRDDLYDLADQLLYDEKGSIKGGSLARVVRGGASTHEAAE